MKASKFSDAQKAFIIKQGEDGTPVAGISQATYFSWKKKHAGRHAAADHIPPCQFVSDSFSRCC